MATYSPLAKANITVDTSSGNSSAGGGSGTGESVVVIDPPYKWYDDLTKVVFCSTEQIECSWEIVPCL